MLVWPFTQLALIAHVNRARSLHGVGLAIVRMQPQRYCAGRYVHSALALNSKPSNYEYLVYSPGVYPAQTWCIFCTNAGCVHINIVTFISDADQNMLITIYKTLNIPVFCLLSQRYRSLLLLSSKSLE